MPKRGKKTAEETRVLQGWKAIGDYLGIGASAAQRWARGGMPVRKQGRLYVADPREIEQWLSKEAHMPGHAHIVTGVGDEDIAGALKESIAAFRRKKRGR